jgi:hypothetical protein
MPVGKLTELLRLGSLLEPQALIEEEVRLTKQATVGTTESLSRLQLAPRPGEVFGRTMSGTLHPGVQEVTLEAVRKAALAVGLAQIERWQLEALLSAALTSLDATSLRKR